MKRSAEGHVFFIFAAGNGLYRGDVHLSGSCSSDLFCGLCRVFVGFSGKSRDIIRTYPDLRECFTCPSADLFILGRGIASSHQPENRIRSRLNRNVQKQKNLRVFERVKKIIEDREKRVGIRIMKFPGIAQSCRKRSGSRRPSFRSRPHEEVSCAVS